MHLTSSPIDWYVARTAGVLAYLILTIDVAIGLGLSGRLLPRTWPRFAVEEVHRFTGILVGVFVSLHIATVAIDSFKPFSLTQLAVPFASSYRPLWMALGIVSAELLLAVAITNWLRGRIPHRAWRTIHYLTLVVWAGATLHGIGTGTDRGATWLIVLYAGCTGIIAALFLRRLGRGRLAPAGLAAAAIPVVLLLGPVGAPASSGSRTTLREAVSGRILQRGSASAGQIVSMTGTGSTPATLLVRADLLLLPSFQRSWFQVEQQHGGVCAGPVGAVRSFGFSGTCRMPDGSRRAVTVSWKLLAGDRLRGTVALHPV